MACNVEIKAYLRDRARVEAELRALGARDLGEESQVDVFWDAPRARLKLRISSRDGAVLIAYSRPDDAALRTSRYDLVPVSHPDELRRALDHALVPAGEVRKRRHLYWVDNVRVHLDAVDGLGAFLELEAVVDGTHPEPVCARSAAELLARFAIPARDHLAVAYVDLLRGAGGAGAIH